MQRALRIAWAKALDVWSILGGWFSAVLGIFGICQKVIHILMVKRPVMTGKIVPKRGCGLLAVELALLSLSTKRAR
jgi:hypothetical protein